MHRRSLIALAVTAFLSAGGAAQPPGSWPQWRGPDADGTADATPPVEWSTTKNVRWQTDLPGAGSSTPVVWGEKVFVLAAEEVAEAVAAEALPVSFQPPGREGRGQRGEGRGQRGGRGRRDTPPPTDPYRFLVLCYHRDTGVELWRTVAAEAVPHEGGHSTNTFASASPVTDGKRLVVSFGSRGVFAFDLDGHRLWEKQLGKMTTRAQFGEGASPALHGDTVVVPWDHEGESFVVALNADDGSEIWRTPREEPTTWATPLIVEHEGVTQAILNGTRVRSYDLATGKLLWECGGQVTNPIPTPLVSGGVVYCMTGYRGYAVQAIPLSARGDVTDTDALLWQRDDAGPYVSSPALVDGLLYFTKSRDAILLVLDAKTGATVLGPERLPELRSLYASPVAAAGRVYFADREGKVAVIEAVDAADPKLEVLAVNDLGEALDASPALSGDALLLRTASKLYCIADE